MTYKIVLLQSEEGYSVSCPGLPGCWSQGATADEATANIQEAVREYLTARDEQDSRIACPPGPPPFARAQIRSK